MRGGRLLASPALPCQDSSTLPRGRRSPPSLLHGAVFARHPGSRLGKERRMRLAVLKERAAAETRVAATPETVKKLVGMGGTVAAEGGGGEGGPSSGGGSPGARAAGGARAGG